MRALIIKPFVFIALAGLCACAPGFETIKVVSDTGAPIEGALVFSHKYGFHKPARAATVSSRNGEAQIVRGAPPSIVKFGYYPIFDGAFEAFSQRKDARVQTEVAVEPSGREGDVIRLHRVQKPSSEAQIVDFKFILPSPSIEIGICDGVSISTEIDDRDGTFRVNSKLSPLHTSTKFFFESADTDVPTYTLDDLHRPFYCTNSAKQIFKIGLAGWHSGSVLMGTQQVPTRWAILVGMPVDSIRTSPEPQLPPDGKYTHLMGATTETFVSNRSKQSLINSIKENVGESSSRQELLRTVKAASIIALSE